MWGVYACDIHGKWSIISCGVKYDFCITTMIGSLLYTTSVFMAQMLTREAYVPILGFSNRSSIICDIVYFYFNISQGNILWGRRGRDLMVVGFTTTCCNQCLSSLAFEYRSGELYSIQHFVIKFVSDLQQVGGFLQVLRFHPLIKLTATI